MMHYYIHQCFHLICTQKESFNERQKLEIAHSTRIDYNSTVDGSHIAAKLFVCLSHLEATHLPHRAILCNSHRPSSIVLGNSLIRSRAQISIKIHWMLKS